MSTLDEIFADVKKEGTPLEDVLTESVPESQPEEEPEVETEVDQSKATAEENIPFHKHPRWIERENELHSLKEREEEMARELAELKAFREESIQTREASEIPDWFVELYGENQVAWEKYSEHEERKTEELERRLLEKQEAERIKETQEVEKWDKWVDGELRKLEDEGITFDRNKLISTMLEYRPTDAQNNFDFRAGLKIYQALEGKPDTAKSEARKQLADTATATSVKGEAPKKDYMTPNDLRNRSWMSL